MKSGPNRSIRRLQVMMNMAKHTLVLGFSLLSALAGIGCGGSSGNMDFTDTFKSSDTVTDTIFAAQVRNASVVSGDFRMTVASSGVSSGFIKLNDNELYGPSDFHNQDFETTTAIQLEDENTIAVAVRGKPGDQLCVRIFEVLAELPDRTIYERCADRAKGKPVIITDTITPTPAL